MKQTITSLLMLFAVFAVIIFIRSSLTRPDKTKEILIENGFTDISITGYALFICGKEDFSSTGFVATNKDGVRVSGAVCGGMMKGYTIRFN